MTLLQISKKPAAQDRQASLHAPAGLELITKNRILLLIWRAYQERLAPAGRWLIPPTIYFGMWGSTSLDNQIHVACLYALAVWIVAALCLPGARPRMRLKARHADRISAGETLPVELTVTHEGRRLSSDLYLLPHRLPNGIEARPLGGVPLPSLSHGQTATVSLGLYCRRRGVYAVQGFRVVSDFPFGLLQAFRVFETPATLLVYPRLTPLARLDIPAGRRYQPGGIALASNLGESLEFIGSRPFREGDSVRDIDWTATARLDQVIVREYRQEYFHRVAVILDTFVPAKASAARQDDFERAVSVAASVSEAMARQEYLVDLFAAGPTIYHLAAGRSLAYLDEILEILACVEPTREETLSALEPEIGEGLAQITTIVCLFLDWDDRRREFTQRLAQNGAALKVIIVRDTVPSLDPRLDSEKGGAIPVLSQADWERGVLEL